MKPTYGKVQKTNAVFGTTNTNYNSSSVTYSSSSQTYGGSDRKVDPGPTMARPKL